MSLEHEGVMTSRATQMDLISQRRCHANYYLGGDRVTICGLRWALEPLATTKSKPVPSVP